MDGSLVRRLVERLRRAILDDGVDYRGRRFSSLSAVAREITGARWSGPRFFGLYSPRLGKMRAGQNG